jgi:periplasmic protein TonB
MAGGYQGLDEPWDSRSTNAWGMLGSVLVHALIVTAVLVAYREKPSRPRVVVPVETVTLVPYKPGSRGGGGSPGPVSRPEPVAPKSAPAPVPSKPQAKPKPQPQPKLKTKPVLPTPVPAKAPVIPTPMAPAIAPKAPASPAPAFASQSRPSRGTGGSGSRAGTGQGGSGGGRGTGSGGGSGMGQGPGTGSGSALQDYLRQIRRLLEQHKEYPWMARSRNIQGVVVMVFTLGSGGQVESHRISQSSGQEVLDEAAQKTIQRVGKFPPLPAAINREKLTIEIPIAFRLKLD